MDAVGDDRIMRQRELLAVLGISRVTLYAWRQRGLFPEPMRVNGSRLIGWRRSVVQGWLARNEAL